MNRLHVFDISPMVYVGDNGMKASHYGYPVGGIQYVLSYLAVAFAQYDRVILCFDSPSFRSSIDRSHKIQYKGGREKSPQVYSQLETLYEGLQKCGVRCEKVAGYEADDLVEWAVAGQCNQCFEIIIYSNDYDLCHSIRQNVTFYSVASSMNNVTPTNYETVLKKGEKIPYNTISAYKVFHGCQSDNVPAVKLESGVPASVLYRSWLRAVLKLGPVSDRRLGANPALIRAFAERSNAFTEKELEELNKRIQLIFPAAKPQEVELEPVGWTEVDEDEFAKFCSLYNARKALNCLKLRRCSLSEQDKHTLQYKGRMLNTGEYAADKDLLFQRGRTQSSILNLQSFEREF